MRYARLAWSLLCLAVVVIGAIPIDSSADSVYAWETWFFFVVSPVIAIWALGLALISLVARLVSRRERSGA